MHQLISEPDQQSSFLCNECLKNLEVAHQFREKCIQIDAELKLQTITNSELLQHDESNEHTETECRYDDTNSLVILDKIPEENEIGDDDIFVFYIKREQEPDVPETDEINEIEINSKNTNLKHELAIEYEINLDEITQPVEENKAEHENIIETQNCETVVINTAPKTALEFVKLDYNVTESGLNENQHGNINVTQLLKSNKPFSSDTVKLETVNLNDFSDNVYLQDFSADDVNLQDGVAYSQEEIVIANSEVPYEIINCDMEGLDLDSFNKQIDERTIWQQEDGSFLCDCGESFLEITEYEKHSLTHNRFFCTVCGKGFESREVIEGHMLLHENNDSHISCPYCKKSIRRNFLTVHINVNHSQNRPTCSICKKKFATEHNRKRHMLTHANSKEFECETCHVKFTQRIALINHRMLHKNMELLSCHSCYSEFSSGEALRKHLTQGCEVSVFEVQENENKTFICNKCGKTYNTLTALKNHIDLAHSVHQMEILCSECGLVLPTKRELLTHVCPHRQSRPKTVNRYFCETCGKSCASQAMLTMHERVHTNERPFKCKKCPLAFKTKTHLNTHQLTHTQIKNFTCSRCSKSFALKGNLVVHSRTHTGERPYKCNLCNQAFIDSKYLKKHKNRKHAIEQWS